MEGEPRIFGASGNTLRIKIVLHIVRIINMLSSTTGNGFSFSAKILDVISTYDSHTLTEKIAPTVKNRSSVVWVSTCI